MTMPEAREPRPVRALLRGGSLPRLAGIVALALGVLLASHLGTGFNWWADDFNNLGYYRTGTNDCHSVDDPEEPFGKILWKVMSHPPADWLVQFNTSVRTLPWALLYVAHALGQPEDFASGRASLLHYLHHYAFFAVDIVLFYLFAGLLFGRTVGLIAALFFSASPINAGFLGWAYQTCDSMGFIFAMVCCICHVLMARGYGPAGRLRALSFVSFILLTLCKEAFLSLWAVLAVLHLHFDHKRGRLLPLRPTLIRYASLIGPYLAVVAAFWILHRLHFGPAPQIHAEFEITPKEMLQKWVLHGYLGMTFWSLNLKGFLFDNSLSWLAGAVYGTLWLGSLGLCAWLVKSSRLAATTVFFCFLLFHAGILHLILMRPVNVELQRWLLYGSPGFLLLLALMAQALLAGGRTRLAGRIAIPTVYVLLMLGLANNLHYWRQEQFLETHRIPQAIRKQYPEFPKGYRVVFFTKDATGYREGGLGRRTRIFEPAYYYSHLAVQFWYPRDETFCFIPHPGSGWDPLKADELQMVYRYAEDAMVFQGADSTGRQIVVGRRSLADIPRGL